MSSGVTQSDVSIFVGDEPVMARFVMFHQALEAALGERSAEAGFKSQLLLCSLNGIAHSMITISAYPWAPAEQLVGAAVRGVLKA
jgi:hypothetical protein